MQTPLTSRMTHADYTTDPKQQEQEEEQEEQEMQGDPTDFYSSTSWPRHPRDILACRSRMGMTVDGVLGGELEAQPDSYEVMDLMLQIDQIMAATAASAHDWTCGVGSELLAFRAHLEPFV